ncbi:hypothetical protein P6N53_07295 [Desulforamulus aquiferis]|uniref:Uncharacterized protein n=2 Tax=Desulforamulus aquiferis TaxID=1397668 RepID=A0AAW7ZCK5_9FIRM|nr:hypothetical protein [Desulforamulus aquiferis]MDO7787018.1 hypothetical protein [Desulforamulus aquiferis]
MEWVFGIMKKPNILIHLKDSTGRIMGYSRLISKNTSDEEIMKLALYIISEAHDLMKAIDEVEYKLLD